MSNEKTKQEVKKERHLSTVFLNTVMFFSWLFVGCVIGFYTWLIISGLGAKVY